MSETNKVSLVLAGRESRERNWVVLGQDGVGGAAVLGGMVSRSLPEAIPGKTEGGEGCTGTEGALFSRVVTPPELCLGRLVCQWLRGTEGLEERREGREEKCRHFLFLCIVLF